MKLVSELEQYYDSWKKVEQILNKLKQSNTGASEIRN